VGLHLKICHCEKHRQLRIGRYACKVQLPAEVQDSKLLDDVYEAGNGVTSMSVVKSVVMAKWIEC